MKVFENFFNFYERFYNKVAEIDSKKKDKKKAVIEDLYNNECSRFVFFITTSIFITLTLSLLFFLFLSANLYPLIHNKSIVIEIIGSLGNILTLSLIISALGVWNKQVGTVLSCLVFAYAFNLILVNYCDFSFFGPLLATAILAGSVYVAFKNIYRFFISISVTLFVLIAIISLGIDNSIPPQIYFKENAKPVNKDEKSFAKRNIVFLVLSNHIGYDFGMEKAKALDEYRKANDTLESKKADAKGKEPLKWEDIFSTVIGGFYVNNGFSFFPHAFNYEGSNNDLIAATTNFNENYIKDSNILVDDNSSTVYNNSPERLALSRNNLFSSFKKNGYKINVYQSKGVNLCSDNMLTDIDVCYTYSNSGELYKTKISPSDKSHILTDMWISSYFKSLSVEKFLKKILFIRNPDDYPVVVNEQFTVLDQLEQDILKADGKNIFYAYIRLPYRPFVYNANCSIMDLSDWRYNEYNSYNNKFVKHDYYQKYFNQLFCTYGYLEKVMQKLRKNNILDHSLILMFGDGGAKIHDYNFDYANDSMDKYTKAVGLLDNMKSRYSTILAYYDPYKKVFSYNGQGCDIVTLLRQNLLKDKNSFCKQPSLVDNDEASKMANNLYTKWAEEINPKDFNTPTIIRDFRMWTEEWMNNQEKK